jgi:hypothetical protein
VSTSTREIPPLGEIEEAIGRPVAEWSHQCHAVSLAIVRSGLLGDPGQDARVARGGCKGVGSQHSWIVLGRNCWDTGLWVADPTLWSYTRTDPAVSVWRNSLGRHVPHGTGSIWAYGAPENCAIEDAIWLERQEGLSGEARAFLECCGPLDRRGWMFLANAPVQEWPSREIIEAIADDPQLGAALVPIDILGMLTSRNPDGLYW